MTTYTKTRASENSSKNEGIRIRNVNEINSCNVESKKLNKNSYPENWISKTTSDDDPLELEILNDEESNTSLTSTSTLNSDDNELEEIVFQVKDEFIDNSLSLTTKNKKRKVLSGEQTLKFINVWKHFIHDLRNTKRNADVISLIQQKLIDKENIILDPKEIRTRINNLTKKYRDEKRKEGNSSTWEFYQILDEVIGNFNNTESVEETISDESTPSNCQLSLQLSLTRDSAPSSSTSIALPSNAKSSPSTQTEFTLPIQIVKKRTSSTTSFKNDTNYRLFLKKRDKKRKILSSEQTLKFINVWKNFIHDLRNTKRNADIILLIQQKLKDNEKIDLDPQEIRTRINNLTKKYRDEKRKDGNSSTWEFYQTLDEVIGNFKNTESAEETIADESTSSYEQYSLRSPSPTPVSVPLPFVTKTPAPSPSHPISSLPNQDESSRGSSVESEKEAFIVMKIDSENFCKFMEKVLENDNKKIKLMEENNILLKNIIEMMKENKEKK